MAEDQHDKTTASAPWGLRLIGDDTARGGVTVDIIAVHGLGANPDHAWVRHKDTRVGIEKDVEWLTDLLPHTFRDYKTSVSARIFCFNYQSAWLGPQLSRNRLESLAGRLLDDIHNVRDNNEAASNRPLILIGHSFGGLVIEQAVVQANFGGGRYEYLVKLIGGIVLLGTPHQGSKSQKWGSIIANLANLMDYGENGLLKEVDEKSMKIFDLIDNFKRIVISMDLAETAVICFYENSPTDYLSRVIKLGQYIHRKTSSIVVEETSARLPGLSSIVLDSDHLKLNKFASAQDGNYVSVSSNLCRIAVEAPEIIRRRRKDLASSQNSHFLVPQKRVKGFVGRENQLEVMRSHFSDDHAGWPLTLVLYALGGQGKSQIALEYCQRWRYKYRGVFWIEANSKATVTQSYGRIAAELVGQSQAEALDSAGQLRMVRGQLERWDEAWLLIFDNYDEPEKFPEVEQFIPTTGNGHVLFTSRNRDLSRLGRPLEVPSMATEEGVMLLLRGYDSDEIQEHHRDSASKIAERLGGLALAIDQAAAYIKYKRMPLDRLNDFLTRYETERKKILSYTPNKFWEYEHINAFTTWELSFQQLGSSDERWEESAAHFLTLAAFFAPNSVTESMFRCYHQFSNDKVSWMKMFTVIDGNQDDIGDKGRKNNDKIDERGGNRPSKNRNWDPDGFWELIARADDLSLLQSISPATGQEGAKLSLHPLIRDWLQLRLEEHERAEYTKETIEVLQCCAQLDDVGSMTLEERTALIMHMDVSLSNEKEFLEPRHRLGHQLESCKAAEWFAYVYFKWSRYRDSVNLHHRVLKTRKSKLHENHPNILETMCNLASSLLQLGNLKEAELLLRQVLTWRETNLGKDHSTTLLAANNLALLLSNQRKFGESESLCRRVLTLREKKLGKDHAHTLASQSSLAGALCDRGKYDEAEVLLQRTLPSMKSSLGENHRITLITMRIFVLLLHKQKKFQEAERICRETVRLSETSLGKEHPDTLVFMYDLAVVLYLEKSEEEAEQICRDTLKSREKVLGKEHPETLRSMEFLSDILYYQDRYGEAEGILREVLALREMVLGKDHPITVGNREALALVLKAQGKFEEAELIAAAGVAEQRE